MDVPSGTTTTGLAAGGGAGSAAVGELAAAPGALEFAFDESGVVADFEHPHTPTRQITIRNLTKPLVFIMVSPVLNAITSAPRLHQDYDARKPHFCGSGFVPSGTSS